MTELRKPSFPYQAVAAGFPVLNSADVVTTSETILEYVARACACDAAALIVADEGHFQVKRAYGWDSSELDALLTRPHAEDVLLLEVAVGCGRPMVVEDTYRSPLWPVLPSIRWIRSHAAIPLTLDDGASAVLCMEARTPGMFIQSDLTDFEQIGLNAAFALRNARVYEQAVQRTAELELLRRISAQLGQRLDLKDQLTRILGELLKVVKDATTDRVFVYEEGRMPWGLVMDIHHHAARVIEEPEPDSLYYLVARQAERLMIDVRGQLHPIPDGERRLAVTALALPLLIGQRVVGVVSVHFDDIKLLDDAMLRLLQLVADQIAVAIENQQYFQHAERRGSELNFMLDVLTSAAVARPIAESLKDVARLIRESLNATAIVIYMPETQPDESGAARLLLQPMAVNGGSKTRWEIDPVVVGDENNLLGLVAKDLYAEVIDDLSLQTAYTPLSAEAISVMLVPLAKGGKLEGLIAAEFAASGNPYDQDMMKLLLILANTLPSVLQNMNLWNQLGESEKRFRQLAESVHEVFCLIDPHLQRVLYVSPAFETIWGRPVDDMRAERSLQRFMETIHPDDRELFIARRNLASGGYSALDAVEVRIMRPVGEVRWVRMRIFPVENEVGQVYRLATITEDITQRKLAEEQALELVVERHKTHLVSEFITTMSHDFRTPLSTINTSTYLLERTNDPAIRSKRLQVIGQQVVRLEKLLDGLLTMTQLDQVVELKLAPVDVCELVRQMSPRAQLAAEARAQVVTVESGSPCRISADVIKLDQAVMHLVHNAIQYSADGALITLAAGMAGSKAFIEVRDRGIGIDASDLPHIFERFYRADRARGSDTGGIGLGLAIAHRIVELHSGSIAVESAPNQGSTFRILLPLA